MAWRRTIGPFTAAATLLSTLVPLSAWNLPWWVDGVIGVAAGVLVAWGIIAYIIDDTLGHMGL